LFYQKIINDLKPGSIIFEPSDNGRGYKQSLYKTHLNNKDKTDFINFKQTGHYILVKK
jgi:hypothetical protein